LGTDEVFNQFLALCQDAGPERCALAGGHQTAAERINELLARLKRAPIPAPAASPPGGLTYEDLLLSQYTPLRVPETWPQDAKDLDAAVRGDGSVLVTEARKLVTPAAFMGATTSAAISCADAPAHRGSRSWPRVIGRLTRVDRFSGALLGWWLWAPCASWPARGQDNYRGPWNAKTKNPILLIGTRHDPSTPYINAVRSARRLGNAVLLTQNGYGHVSFHDPSACIDRARVAYLVRLTAPPRAPSASRTTSHSLRASASRPNKARVARIGADSATSSSRTRVSPPASSPRRWPRRRRDRPPEVLLVATAGARNPMPREGGEFRLRTLPVAPTAPQSAEGAERQLQAPLVRGSSRPLLARRPDVASTAAAARAGGGSQLLRTPAVTKPCRAPMYARA
jgi:TAP-like protein